VFTTVLGSRPGGNFLPEVSRAFATAVPLGLFASIGCPRAGSLSECER